MTYDLVIINARVVTMAANNCVLERGGGGVYRGVPPELV